MKNKQLFITAVEAGDADAVRRLVATDETLALHVDAPWFSFAAPAIVFAAASRNRDLIQVLLEAGADVDAKSRWWAGGVSALQHAAGAMLTYDRELAHYLIAQGATIDAHAAAGLDMLETLTALIREDPEVVNAPGPDGMSPLHFAATPRIAELLLTHGADINRRDRDHNGTPARWTVRSRPDVCRYLLEQGAAGDIVLYCAIGDVQRAAAALTENPALVDARIDNKAPMGYTVASVKRPNRQSERPIDIAPGGHVYTHTLGPSDPLFEIALQAQQPQICDMLLERGYRLKLREWYRVAGQGPRNMDRLVKQLLGRGYDINAGQEHRHGVWAPLHWFAQRGITAAMSCLLANGADPNVTDDTGRTPMHIIAQKGVGKNQIHLLIAHGGDVNRRDAAGKTPLDYARAAKKNVVAQYLTEHIQQAEAEEVP